MLGNLLRAILGKLGRLGKRPGQTALVTMTQADAALAQGDHAGALRLYQQVLAIQPEHQDAWGKLGFCQATLGQNEPSAHSFGMLARLAPDSRTAHANLGHLALLGLELTRAVSHYRRALSCPPDANPATSDAALNSSLGFALMRQGLPDAAIACLRQSLRQQPENITAVTHLLLAMQYSALTKPDELFMQFRRWSEQHEHPLLPLHQPHGNTPDPTRRLRIGYVSGDFAAHAVANFIEPVLRHHQRSDFNIFCYSNRSKDDDYTPELRALSDHWREVHTLDDEAMSNQIRADAIDILVDLSGHTEGNRLRLFARKPAPVQMTWLGYPATTGLQSIDYRITDGVADPSPLADQYHSERLLRLPRSQWCYRPARHAPPLSPLPALASGRIMFGSLNNLAKLNEQTLRLWARVLQALPAAGITVVSVTDVPSRHRVANALIEYGAAPAQVRILGPLEETGFWRIREEIDIVLDAFPYNGTTTTCEALWSGLPVITLAGAYGAARNSASLLSAVGLEDLIARDQADYVAIAAHLAADIPHLAGLRAGMRQRMLDAGLCDGARFTRDLESLYRLAWQTWCDTRASEKKLLPETSS